MTGLADWAGPVKASLDLRISIKTRPDWADHRLRHCFRVSAFIEAYDVFRFLLRLPHPTLPNHLSKLWVENCSSL